ncbi:MAG: leucyl aminopeptidase [Armatimonadota bacterium]|nr:leucyl aminopeptidase [Armatimonadota bacterium]
MQIDVQATAPLEFETPCLVVPLWQEEALSGLTAELNERLDGLIQSIITDDGFKGSNGETRVLYTQDKLKTSRVILLGQGKRDKLAPDKLRQAIAKAARGVRAIKRESFALALPALKGIKPEEAATAASEGIILGLYVFRDFKTPNEHETEVSHATLLTSSAGPVRRGVRYGQVAADATIRARVLVNLPSNKKSPQFLAEQAQQIADANGLRCEVWDEQRIQEERMGALWGVGMGSDNPPRFIILEYAPRGQEAEPAIALVGKGMTFDSGGYSLKPPQSMEDMKDDMSGAAVVLGAMSALKDLKIPRRVLGIIPTAENMVNGHAQRPGDIVTARNGKTIEVLNTDAEGRLILADALSYVVEQKPAAIIDFATLTGAIGIALGQEAAGLFTNDAGASTLFENGGGFAQKIWQAGERTGDRVWPFPTWDEYKEHVKGSVSDLKNIGIERRAGSIAGAVFLEQFVDAGIPWAHLDIAAVSFIREDRPLTARGATGFGVRLTLELLRSWS